MLIIIFISSESTRKRQVLCHFCLKNWILWMYMSTTKIPEAVVWRRVIENREKKEVKIGYEQWSAANRVWSIPQTKRRIPAAGMFIMDIINTLHETPTFLFSPHVFNQKMAHFYYLILLNHLRLFISFATPLPIITLDTNERKSGSNWISTISQ